MAADLGLSMPTIHQNITELLEAGLIEVAETKPSTGGRPAVGYKINKNFMTAIGAAVSASHLRILATDLKQEVLAYKKIRHDFSDSNNSGHFVAAELEKFIDEYNIDRNTIHGVGITVPGIVDWDERKIRFSPTLKLRDFSVSYIKEDIPYPVHIENDSTCAGAAEWMARNSIGTETEEKIEFAYLWLESGVGGAIVMSNGVSLKGDNQKGAEFGHMCVIPNGKKCNCGKKGCLEAYCGADRLTTDLGIETEDFFNGLKEGNKEYRKVFDEFLKALSIAVTNLRMAFDCDIILGGSVSRFLEPYLPELRDLVTERDPFDDNANYIKLGIYPDHAGMRGAAWYFIHKFVGEI